MKEILAALMPLKQVLLAAKLLAISKKQLTSGSRKRRKNEETGDGRLAKLGGAALLLLVQPQRRISGLSLS